MADLITTYTVILGDRWDTIAGKLYGDPTANVTTETFGTHGAIATLIMANPEVVLDQPLAAGTNLRVYTIDDTQQPPNSSILPPWKQ